MTRDDDDPSGFAPREWYIAFRGRSSIEWFNRVPAMGRFRHVLAFGYCAASKTWLFYNPGLWRVWIAVVPDEAAQDVIAAALDDAQVLKIKPWGSGSPRFPRWWCVPDIAGVVGIEAKSLRPEALFRECLAHGAVIVS